MLGTGAALKYDPKMLDVCKQMINSSKRIPIFYWQHWSHQQELLAPSKGSDHPSTS